MRKIIAVGLLLFATPALAQQQPDPAFLQQSLAATQQQRNAALDGLAEVQARALVEIGKLKARITELEKAAPPAPKPAE